LRIDIIRKLTEIADKSICLISVIKNNETSIGTGFLIKLPIYSKKRTVIWINDK